MIALIDPAHANHDAAHRWLTGIRGDTWATCPITENGAVRIVSHPKYPNAAASPAEAARSVASLRSLLGHELWADDLSLVASDWIEPAMIGNSAQVTDTYLLALALSRGAKLATFDRRLSVSAVRDGKIGLHILGNNG